MMIEKSLGLLDPLLPGKPLGSNYRLSTVFLPENFVDPTSEAKIETRNFEPGRNLQTENLKKIRNLTSLEHNSQTVVESLSQIRPLNESTMELSTAIAPEIAIDPPGSNPSLVPVSNTGLGELSGDRELPNSWSSLAELVENNIDEIDEEEIIFTPTGFQRQNRHRSSDEPESTVTSSAEADTYSPSVTQPVTVTSPYFAPEPEAPENLDAIVQIVYRRIVDRLQIERERNGRFYSGRLRW